MSTPYPFLTKNARGSYNTAINGYTFTTFLLLKGVAGITDAELIFNALNDPAVPVKGSNLSGIDPFLETCWLRDIGAEVIDQDNVRITLDWQQSPWGVLQIDAGAQLSQIETNLDISGEPITLEYTYPSDYGGTTPSAEEEALRDQTKEQGGSIVFQNPEHVRVYTVRQTLDPTDQAILFSGKTNDDLWQGGFAGTWLCTSITGTNDNSGIVAGVATSWINRYEFQFRQDGWDPQVVYSDDLTGKPVPVKLENVPFFPAVSGNGKSSHAGA